MARARLTVVGMPIDDKQAIAPETLAAFAEAEVVIGESRAIAFRSLAKVPGGREKPIFLLDHLDDATRNELTQRLTQLAAAGGKAVLFSDCGMPILFDPGSEVLTICRNLGFEIRSKPGATSWASAAALCGWLPPFLIVGFLPREKEERLTALRRLKSERAHCVLLDTPYRFELLLSQCRDIMGDSREAFLAWDISLESERLWWGTLKNLIQEAKQHAMRKGEFILVVKGAK